MSAQKRTRTQKSTAQKKRQSPVKRRKVYNEKHVIGFLFVVCFSLTVMIAGLLSSMVALRIPDIRNVSHYRPLQTSYIVDRQGRIIEKIFKEDRRVIGLHQMPPLLPKAFVAAEDGRFYEHPGLDFISVLRAAVVNLKRGSRAQGGSTITQQVARSLLLSREKTYLRKFKEAILAWRIDSLLSKDEILYIYLNEIYLGGGAYGVEAAAQKYFNKRASNLSLGEIALLAGLPQAPSRYSPFHNKDMAIKRQRYVLNRMVIDGYIQADEAQKAFKEGVRLADGKERYHSEAGYYNAIVKKRVQKVLGVPLVRAGVTIHTYLDTDMQEKAVNALRSGVVASSARQNRLGASGQGIPQAALVSIDSCTGQVPVLLGGTDYSKSSYNRAAIARRQVGSAFKPIIFATALEKGWSGDSTILDAPISIPGARNSRWKPKNYTGKYHGNVTLEEALTHSYNTASVRLLQKVGLNPVMALSEDLGIRSEMPGDLSLALGSVDVTLLEISSAYTPFLCSGMYISPRFVKKIEKHNGDSISIPRQMKKRVMGQRTAKQMKEILQRVISDGTGKRAKGLAGETGGKTGTTNNLRDAWFIGFKDSLITGVWVGHDKNQSLGEGENGGRTAAPIWRDYMNKAQDYTH